MPTTEHDGLSPKIAVRQLSLFYGRHHALHQVSLTFYAHRITAIIGPSGCGKSTLLRCLNRMNDALPGIRIEGEVLLDGHDIYSRKQDLIKLRKTVGMVFQRPNVFPLSVFDNVAYGPRVHGLKNRARLSEIVERSLAAVGLWGELRDRLGAPALDLSLGNRQLLCIARLVAVEPEVILLDEPASALDPISTLRIEELMKELRKEYTIVIVTHNMQQAARASDRTVFMLSGDLVEHGETDQIFTNPRDQRTERYVTGKL
ncbi:MAG TPA: phosphate ABC transporter ATP-binding protein PstB [Bacillota bacterium]